MLGSSGPFIIHFPQPAEQSVFDLFSPSLKKKKKLFILLAVSSLSCSTWTLPLGPTGLAAPQPGIKPESPALEGKLSTTGPPEWTTTGPPSFLNFTLFSVSIVAHVHVFQIWILLCGKNMFCVSSLECCCAINSILFLTFSPFFS